VTRAHLDLASLGRRTWARAVAVCVVAAACALWPAEARAQGDRYAVIVQGTTGGEPYTSMHRKWLNSLVGILRGRFAFDAAHIVVLAEQPGQGEQLANAENVKAAFGRLAGQAKDGDLVFVLLIGHGGGDGADAKFNLVGPDLTVVEWSAMMSSIKARLAFVDTTGGSFPYLKGMSAPGRVVITATGLAGQKYDTVFPDAFIQALTAPAADTDKNGRISLLEAFVYASSLVKQYYEQKFLASTEHAVFNDTGDGAAADKAVPGAAAGTVAGLTYLDVVAAPKSSDPEVQQLLLRQQALTQQVDELRRRRPQMTPEAYDQEFEKLIIDLSLVSRDVRRRTGG
jgi:hypothetical protein